MMIGVEKIPRARTRLEESRRKLVVQASLMARVTLHLGNVPPSTAADGRRNANSAMAPKLRRFSPGQVSSCLMQVVCTYCKLDYVVGASESILLKTTFLLSGLVIPGNS